ncbi:DUF6193 family natural product biosynthesis protein [Streptomyces sp. NPDC058289]|uniref:DUF6193 family natural product biosynthesis protein n=1 Tax=Streptomyces sp. NPDC058289 TaxID=3346425 RepID=UPI0036EB0701
MELRPERREIMVALRLPIAGVAGLCTVRSLDAVIDVAQAWQAGMPLADMAARWEFLRVSRKALAHDQGKGVAHEWVYVRGLPDGLIDHNLVEAAFRSPELSTLFPMVSHGSLQFRRFTVSDPGSDIPSVFPAGEGRWHVTCPRDEHIPASTAETVDEAVRLVLEGSRKGAAPQPKSSTTPGGRWPTRPGLLPEPRSRTPSPREVPRVEAPWTPAHQAVESSEFGYRPRR